MERVDVELGEILCTLVAVSGDMCDGAIDIKPIKAEWGPTRPAPPKPPVQDDFQRQLEAMFGGASVHYIEWD